MIRKLKYYGDPVLRQLCKPVEAITDEIRELVRDMLETMEAHHALGLAAPQVGVLLRVFVGCVEYEDEKGEVHAGKPWVYINPTLKNPSEMLVERSEGCLSVPKLYLAIPRPMSVVIEAMDVEGNLFTRECTGYLARNVLHENDHLNGVLFFDWLKGKRRSEVEPHLRLIKAHYSKKS